ncbi:MAG TPA: DUF1501 domain-containing protein [Gemmataceae bacterium]|nr:DUF1501 domain-containing protein [Gemmataceae bacterium]
MHKGNFPALDRRHFVKHLAGLSLMALPGVQFIQRLRAAAPTMRKEHKSMIILWMSGGPSHMDTWDLKPDAPTGGEFKPMSTSVSGIQICEHLPTVAKQMHHLSIVRSLVTNEGSHERGRVLMHTARQPSVVTHYPSVGSVVAYELTPKELALPGFISIGRPADGPGFLGMNFAPFTVQNPGQPPNNIRPPTDVEDLRVGRRQQLFHAIEDGFEKRGEAAKSHSEIYGKAFSLVAEKSGKKVFDLGGEKPGLLRDYGERGNFGKACLLARRLVEAGVPCVEIDLGGWDNHQRIFPTLKTNLLPELDKGMGTLVRDLVDRGLWKNTVLVWLGEFGRTPRINQNAGRDHWARCWSVVVGGGGIKGGQVIGSTSKDGTDVADRPTSVGDLFATLYKGLGIDPGLQIRDNVGRPHSIAGENGKPLPALV